VEHLLGAQLCLARIQARRLEQFGDPLARQSDQVNAAILTRGDVARHRKRVDMPGDLHQLCVHEARAYSRRWNEKLPQPCAAYCRGVHCGGGAAKLPAIGKAPTL
jgi:hypothetical protein